MSPKQWEMFAAIQQTITAVAASAVRITGNLGIRIQEAIVETFDHLLKRLVCPLSSGCSEIKFRPFHLVGHILFQWEWHVNHSAYHTFTRYYQATNPLVDVLPPSLKLRVSAFKPSTGAWWLQELSKQRRRFTVKVEKLQTGYVAAS